MELNCFYKTELSPKEIFNSMQKNIYDFSPNSISINSKYLNIRSKLLNLLRTISAKMCFKSQTYFLSIYYLDILFTNSKNKKIELNYNIMGLACLLLSAKNCENDPIVPELKYFTKIYNKIIGNKNAISVSDLFYSEVMAIKLLNHKLNFYTIYDFNSFFFNNNILTEEQLKFIDNNFEIENNFTFYNNNNVSIKIKRIYDKIYRLSRYYLDILLENSLCIKYSSLLLSIIIMKKSIEYILLQEKCNNNNDIDKITKEKFIIKNNNYFNRIIKGYYEFDYENIPEYQKLINEYDIIELFNQNKKEIGNNHYSIRQSKTLTSFNKNKLRKYNNYYKNNKINNQNIYAFNIKVNEINFSSSNKPHLHKLNINNNINNQLTNFNIINNNSGQNMPFVSNNKNEIDENAIMNQKNFCRNLGIDNCTKDKTYTNQQIDKNIDLNNYFSENLNSLRKTVMNVFSPNKMLNSDKKINDIVKRTKSNEYENNKINNINANNIENFDDNYMDNKERLTLNINNKNINQLTNIAKPYYKKVIQNYNSKLNNKNINQIISNKYNFDNENENQEMHNNHLVTNKIENKIKPKYELKTDTKTSNKTMRKFNYKDFNVLNLNKGFKDKTSYSNNKDKKISKIFHINLNSKYTIEANTQSNSLFENKNLNEENFSSTLYMKNKKRENKTSKSINNFDKILRRTKINNGLNIKGDNKLKNYLQISDEFNETNYSSNKLTNSSKIIGFSIMKIKKEKTKEKIPKNRNKIYLTENALNNDINPNKINSDIYLNEYLKAKKIEVKKNKFDNEFKYRYKKTKKDNILNQYGFKSKNLEDHLFKKNTSTIVINNNININFGNKSISAYKDNKKFGQNSISSLLNKIPLCYKSEEN